MNLIPTFSPPTHMGWNQSLKKRWDIVNLLRETEGNISENSHDKRRNVANPTSVAEQKNEPNLFQGSISWPKNDQMKESNSISQSEKISNKKFNLGQSFHTISKTTNSPLNTSEETVNNIPSFHLKGIHDVCRNVGGKVAGFELFREEIMSTNQVTMAILFTDYTSNHTTMSSRYCTPSSACALWYCACGRTSKIDTITKSLLGVLFLMPTGILYFLPLVKCIEAHINEGASTLNNRHCLPVNCETTLVQRWKLMRDIFSNTNCEICLHNAQLFMVPFITILEKNFQFDISSVNLFDVKIAAYLLNTNIDESSLEIRELFKDISSTVVHDSDAEDLGWLSRTIRSTHYEMLDLKVLSCSMANELNKYSLMNVLKNIEMPTSTLLARMELYGIHVDSMKLNEIRAVLDTLINLLKNEIFNSSGVVFNISSPEQVSQVLFEKLQLPRSRAKSANEKFYSTSEEELFKIRDSHPIVNKILNYRTVTKLLSTYVDGISSLPNIITERKGVMHTVHPHWNQTSVRTGRLSCSKPNMQNIPSNLSVENHMISIRSMFVPENRSIFVSADYSQIEMRVLAHLSGDSNLCDLFYQSGDIYYLLAGKLFSKPISEITDDERHQSKVICLGIIYGMGVSSVASKLQLDFNAATAITNAFFGKFRQVQNWIANIKSQTKNFEHVRSMSGRIRHITNISSTSSSERSTAERQAVNSIVQGSASDLIKCAMILAHRELHTISPSTMIDMPLQIHDELIFQVQLENSVESALRAKEIIQCIRVVMEQKVAESFCVKVPLVANFSVGRCWGNMIPVKDEIDVVVRKLFSD